MTDIQTVIFDWGGVLIEDPGPGLMQYGAHRLKVDPAAFVHAHQLHCACFCKGIISEEEFWERVCQTLECKDPRSLFWIEAFKATYQPRPAVLNLVEALQQKGIRTALLSNTEKPCMEFFLHDLKYTQFDHLVFSCAEGCWKPEPEIYGRAAERTKTPPRHCIFIDDREEFVVGAENFGMQAILYTGFKTLLTDLREKGLDI